MNTGDQPRVGQTEDYKISIFAVSVLNMQHQGIRARLFGS
jgi:hypothetical protein